MTVSVGDDDSDDTVMESERCSLMVTGGGDVWWVGGDDGDRGVAGDVVMVGPVMKIFRDLWRLRFRQDDSKKDKKDKK